MNEPKEQTSWSLRPAQPEDETFLEELFCRLHAADFAGVSLPQEQVRGLVQMQARAQRLGYLRDFPSAQSSIVLAETGPIGRLLVDYTPRGMHLVDIALLPELHGRGIGTKLLQVLQAEARERNIPLHLSVQPANPALQLYLRLGFKIVSGGVQLGMEWSPNQEHASASQQLASEETKEPTVGASAGGADDPAVLFPSLAGRQFQPEGASPELHLHRVQHYRPTAKASFSLFFRGPLEPILPQGTHTLHLLDGNGEPVREFSIFMGPVGPAEGQMEYEAVFNL